MHILLVVQLAQTDYNLLEDLVPKEGPLTASKETDERQRFVVELFLLGLA